MAVWRIRGGRELYGSVDVQGSKNAVLPIMAAAILGGGTTRLKNCPRLSDVDASVEILRHLGCGVMQKGHEIVIDSKNMDGKCIPRELMLRMRSSVMYMGAILARCGEVTISRPGGCELGCRPIDLHLEALRRMGAEISESGGDVTCRAAALKGTHINLDLPSVGATENVMLAACAAEGETVITNAACEPEISALGDYLRLKGAKIKGTGTPEICVSGPADAVETEYTVIPDRIAAATYMCAAACAGGDVTIENMIPAHVDTISTCLKSMGCGIIVGGNRLRIRRFGPMKAVRPVVTKPYPGFPTDAQALLMAASLKAEGTSVFVENIFENRYRHVYEMRRLGADVRIEGRVAMVTGVQQLTGAPVEAGDLRGGAALILAGLCAEGETEVSDAGHVLRGYDGIDAALNSLGGDVEYLD